MFAENELHGFKVGVSVMNPMLNIRHIRRFHVCQHMNDSVEKNISITCSGEPQARYVILQLLGNHRVLHICELEVYGGPGTAAYPLPIASLLASSRKT